MHACDRKELAKWPQYRGRIVEDSLGRKQIHLNVWGYFLFWTAFYVLRGSQTRPEAAPAAAPRYGHLTPSLGTVRKVLRGDISGASYPLATRVAFYRDWSPRTNSLDVQSSSPRGALIPQCVLPDCPPFLSLPCPLRHSAADATQRKKCS